MSEASWAERKARKAAHSIQPVDFGSCEGIRVFAKTLEAEHKRAVRVVKRQLDLYQRQREVEKDEHMRDLLAGSIFACVDLLESLQRGR